jgi:hypothetical protein
MVVANNRTLSFLIGLEKISKMASKPIKLSFKE